MHRGEIVEMRKGGEINRKEKDEDRLSPELAPIKRQKIKTTTTLDEDKSEISEFDTKIDNEKDNKEVETTDIPLRRSKRNAKSGFDLDLKFVQSFQIW
ncbi:unnamed protein product [Meloidogyne enterolobii]|uniref:Uncharacterized protein n=1 Tax=Meloidogyne enterolobii TaxID=390850 RepID=A0ACB0YUP5_MELEN